MVSLQSLPWADSEFSVHLYGYIAGLHSHNLKLPFPKTVNTSEVAVDLVIMQVLVSGCHSNIVHDSVLPRGVEVVGGGRSRVEVWDNNRGTLPPFYFYLMLTHTICCKSRK